MICALSNNQQKKIRIGYHWPEAHGQKTGIARYIENITKNVHNLNFEFINYADLRRAGLKRADLRNFSIPYLGRFLFLLDLLFFSFNIRRQKIDVYWGSAHKLPLFRIKGVSYVVTIHDLVWKTCPLTMPLRRRLTERFFFPIAIRNADIILAVSQSTANDIVKYFPFCAAKIKVIPLAGMLTEHADVAVSSACDKKYILFVGTIEPRKNIRNMLKAYATLPKALKETYKFYIVGSAGWGNIKLDEMIVEFDLIRYVEWKPAVNDQELVKLYQNAYCLLFPSLYEGFGLPILEAQSFGVPVITSNLSSMPEVVGDGGLLVDPNSIESIKNALKSLLDNVGLRDSLSQKAKENSHRFSWEKTCQATYFAFSKSINLRDM